MGINNGWEVCVFDIAEFMDWKQTQTSPKTTEIDSGLEEWKTATCKIISSRTGCKVKKLYQRRFLQLAVGKKQ